MMRAALLMLVAASAWADDSVELTLREQFDMRQARAGSLVQLQDGSTQRQQLDVRWQWQGPLATAVRGVASAQRQQGGVHVNELSLDHAAGPGYATLGKKVMSWDVGYAFRPLDVVQQEDRRAINGALLDGVPMAAWEVFDASRALTLVWSNPGRRKGEQPRGDGSLALRLYHRAASRDEYAVLRLSDRNGLEAGISFSRVEGEALEWHGSLLLQQRHDNWGNTLAPDAVAPANPSYWQSFAGGGKALIGMTWTTEQKFSVVAEAWWDRTAYSGAQWRAWRTRNVALQTASPALRAANLAWQAGSLQGPSLRQQNVMVRAAQRGDELELSGDLLWMPEDGGRIASMALSWARGPWAASVSLRHFGGSAGALVQALPLRRVAYASVSRSW